MDMRTSVNTACALVVGELRLAGKDIFSEDDIKRALILAERGSKSSLEHYMGEKGHLAKRGFLSRVPGGWELSRSSRTNGTITIKIMPGNEYMAREIQKSVGNAVKKYGKVVGTKMEV